jgi:hypothetical protein
MIDNYTPGEGCECSARCGCECGCDANWTPREVYELREQRDRLAGELKEAQDAIEMMLNDSACRRIAAYTKDQLTAIKGGSHE